MKEKDRRLAELRADIPEVTPEEARARVEAGAVMLDVREPDEVVQGSPPGAQRIVRGFLELRVEDAVPDKLTPIVVICAGGVRSLFAAENLRMLGYQNVCSMTGGFNRWKNEGNPVEVPRVLDPRLRERYSRHLLMPEVGEAGQMRLAESRVLLIGAGGLGSPAAYYLAAAGVGTVGIVDHDVVDRSNLQRQILHTDDRVGQPKADSARRTLEGLNPQIHVDARRVRLDDTNADDLLSGHDVVLDGCDNFRTRYAVNDACVRLGLPNVHGSIHRFEGQVSVFWAGRGPCYRCLHPSPPPPDLSPNCAEAGVLGVLPGVIGMLEATETLKILLDLGRPLIGRLLTYDALGASFREYGLRRDTDCAACSGVRPPTPAPDPAVR